MSIRNNGPLFERERLVARAAEQLEEIEQYFNDAAYWNGHVRKPDQERIEADPGGHMKRLADGLAKMLQNETPHKIGRDAWIAEIKRIAIEKYEFNPEAAEKIDWAEYAWTYYLDETPEGALLEDLSNA